MQFATRSSNILIVDSDRASLEMLQIRLTVVGYHPSIARTGATAMEMIRHARPAAMILELNLPDMCGLEVLEAIRAGGGAPIRTMVIGKRIAPEAIRRAIELGARDCVAKPFSGAEVLDRLSRMLTRTAPPPAASSRVVLV